MLMPYCPAFRNCTVRSNGNFEPTSKQQQPRAYHQKEDPACEGDIIIEKFKQHTETKDVFATIRMLPVNITTPSILQPPIQRPRKKPHPHLYPPQPLPKPPPTLPTQTSANNYLFICQCEAIELFHQCPEVLSGSHTVVDLEPAIKAHLNLLDTRLISSPMFFKLIQYCYSAS